VVQWALHTWLRLRSHHLGNTFKLSPCLHVHEKWRKMHGRACVLTLRVQLVLLRCLPDILWLFACSVLS
jgi:hypothetical protein